MAKFVIAGKSNCPHFAKAELLGDACMKNLPNFEIYKKVVDPNEWNDWLDQICSENEWRHTKSPLIWRELVYRGGKAMLVGDANDFQEYVRAYYGYLGPVAALTSKDLLKISAENETVYRLDQEEKRRIEASVQPLIVTITNPESPVVYYFVNEMLSGSVFGKHTEVIIRLYSSSSSRTESTSSSDGCVRGLKMEIEDLASQNLKSVTIVNTGKKAFENCDFAILLDCLGEFTEDPADVEEGSRGKKSCRNSFASIAQELDEYAKATCKILVSPYENRREIYLIVNEISKHLKRLNKEKDQLIGNSTYDEMACKAVLARRLSVDAAHVKNVAFVGQSVGASFYVDLTRGEVTNYDGAVWAKANSHWRNLVHLVADRDWIKTSFINLVHERESLVKEKLNRDPILAFSQSIVALCRLWSFQSNDDDTTFYSAIVHPNGNYSIKDDIYLSLPVRFQNGSFQFVSDLKLQPFVQDIVKNTKEKLQKRFKDGKVLEDSNDSKTLLNRVKYD